MYIQIDYEHLFIFRMPVLWRSEAQHQLSNAQAVDEFAQGQDLKKTWSCAKFDEHRRGYHEKSFPKYII